MADLATSDVFLVGSISVPSDTAEEALRLATSVLGNRLFALPDGEVGARRMWIGGLGETTYSRHPDLELLPDVPAPFGSYRVKEGITAPSLEGYLPYGDAALASYEVFTSLKKAGVVPPELRFQLALPTPHAAICVYFAEVERDWSVMQRAYLDAVRADIDRVLGTIPPAELVIQWDYCTELVDIAGADTGVREMNAITSWIPRTSAAEKFAEHTAAEYLRPLTSGLPDEVMLGFHLCMGTFPQFPTAPLDDLGWVVRAANRVIGHASRRIDYLHLPGMPGAGRDYFAPMRDLESGDAKLILGIELKDGRDALRARARAAREFVGEFAISHYCGYGRDSTDELAALLSDLVAVADNP